MVAFFFMRRYHLGKEPTLERLQKVFFWDNFSGISVMLVMGVGISRLWLEKGPDYYLENHVFWAKMAILGIGWCCEMPIMISLIKWRIVIGKGKHPDTARLPLLRKLELLEGTMIFFVIFAAALMSRGAGVIQSSNISMQGINLENGAKIYREKCQTCHQADGRGQNGLAANFIDDSILTRPDATLLSSIKNGIEGTTMPAWENLLSEQDRKDVLGWIRSQYQQ